jgi:hypothetical protein
MAYMERMERLYMINSAMAVDDGNNGVGGWGGEAGAPGGDGITRVNCPPPTKPKLMCHAKAATTTMCVADN